MFTFRSSERKEKGDLFFFNLMDLDAIYYEKIQVIVRNVLLMCLAIIYRYKCMIIFFKHPVHKYIYSFALFLTSSSANSSLLTQLNVMRCRLKYIFGLYSSFQNYLFRIHLMTEDMSNIM